MPITATMPAEFQRDLEADALRWLRGRLLVCCILFGTIVTAVTIAAGVYARTNVPTTVHRHAVVALVLSGLSAVIFLAPIPYLLLARERASRGRLIWIVTGMLSLAGLLTLAQLPSLVEIRNAIPEARSTLPPGLLWLLSMAALHMVTSLLVPWTPREAIRPLIPILVVNAIGLLFIDKAPIVAKLGVALATSAIAVPGLLIAWLRHSRFRARFHLRAMSDRFSEISSDLTAARRIHESILPRPIPAGPIRFDFRYQPMREIGGDYVHAHAAQEALTVVIIDVTGHGIGAALAVNRLHTELIHLLASDPDSSPARLLTALNSALLTLASHSMFATALCLRADAAANTLAWASAGHPPAFLRAPNATIRRLDSTTIVLGACDAADFTPDEQSTPFHAGDAVIAYTDGTIESRNQQGRMLSIDGLENMIRTLDPMCFQTGGGACEAILATVDGYRFGPIQDDTLIVEISRPL